jgi:hypothetical protein
VLLLRITVHIHAPELAPYLALPHSLDVSMAEELLSEINSPIIDAVVQLNA